MMAIRLYNSLSLILGRKTAASWLAEERNKSISHFKKARILPANIQTASCFFDFKTRWQDASSARTFAAPWRQRCQLDDVQRRQLHGSFTGDLFTFGCNNVMVLLKADVSNSSIRLERPLSLQQIRGCVYAAKKNEMVLKKKKQVFGAEDFWGEELDVDATRWVILSSKVPQQKEETKGFFLIK